MRANLWAVAVIAFGAPRCAFLCRRKAPNAPLLAYRPVTAIRKAAATRLAPGRVALDRTRPPVFLIWGHNPSQLQKCFTVANLDTSGPISLTIVRAVISAIP